MAEVTARKRNGSDKWEYRIELAKIDGKRQQKSKGGFKTKAEALKAGREALKEYETGGQLVIPSEISISDLLDNWLNEYRKTELKQVTAEGYEKKVRLYIKPAIGQYKVKAITRQTLQELVTNLADQGYSKNTVSSVRSILTSCFDWAEMNRLVSQNPAYRLKLPKNTEVKQRTDPHVYITTKQMEMIFKRFPEGSSSHLPMMLAYHCGLRLGETYALTWEDIDLKRKILFVNRQVQWFQNKTRTQKEKEESNGSKSKGGGYWYFSRPKYLSFRTIELDNIIIELLEREKAKQEKAQPYYAEHYIRYYADEKLTFGGDNHDGDSDQNKIGTDKTAYEINLICRRENGEYITPRTMQHASAIIHKQLNFPEFDFHSIRHTHATMLRTQGAPDIYIKERLGHAKLETTMEVYANHLTQIDIEKGSMVLNKLF